MATDQGSRNTKEVALAMALDQHWRRVAQFMDDQHALRRESERERALALDDGRVREASLLGRFDECLGETGMQLSALLGRLKEHSRPAMTRRSAADDDGVDTAGRAPPDRGRPVG